MKHPHRLLLMQKRTWKCTLPGCNFFVHLGLAHVLLGKSATCWDCGETFTVDEYALKDEMPKCFDCRGDIPEVIEPTPIEEVEEMNEARRKLHEELGLIPKRRK